MSADTRAQLADASTTIGATSVLIVPAGKSNNFLSIENVHATQDVWLNLTGGTAVANAAGNTFLPHLTRIIFDKFVPTSAITAIATGATTPLTILFN